ncbi:hypothetical protein CCR75_008525 [Bremia lactucae]|uniref:Uncharacterized protein n=1 Tax=Bremia lactucae TaxID=4779 RepID=A0A976FHR1_BRELC|nr:hypothetical protein CCR75_008525 [Bremia lactucae]
MKTLRKITLHEASVKTKFLAGYCKQLEEFSLVLTTIRVAWRVRRAQIEKRSYQRILLHKFLRTIPIAGAMPNRIVIIAKVYGARFSQLLNFLRFCNEQHFGHVYARQQMNLQLFCICSSREYGSKLNAQKSCVNARERFWCGHFIDWKGCDTITSVFPNSVLYRYKLLLNSSAQLIGFECRVPTSPSLQHRCNRNWRQILMVTAGSNAMLEGLRLTCTPEEQQQSSKFQ